MLVPIKIIELALPPKVRSRPNLMQIQTTTFSEVKVTFLGDFNESSTSISTVDKNAWFVNYPV